MPLLLPELFARVNANFEVLRSRAIYDWQVGKPPWDGSYPENQTSGRLYF
jgi:hypothetical protein